MADSCWFHAWRKEQYEVLLPWLWEREREHIVTLAKLALHHG